MSKATQNQDANRYIRCLCCGGRVVCKPSTSSYGRWFGVGKCGAEVLVDRRGTHNMRLCQKFHAVASKD